MKVLEVMNKNVVTCHPMEKLGVIVNKLELFHIAGMPVVEKLPSGSGSALRRFRS